MQQHAQASELTAVLALNRTPTAVDNLSALDDADADTAADRAQLVTLLGVQANAMGALASLQEAYNNNVQRGEAANEHDLRHYRALQESYSPYKKQASGALND